MRLWRTLLLLIFVINGFQLVYSQDISLVKKNLKILTSKHFSGRGYVNQGDDKASKFLVKKFKKYGLLPINHSYTQPYSFRINTFPKKLSFYANNQVLEAGVDYIVRSSATTIKGEFPCIYMPLTDKQKEMDLSSHFLVGNEEYKELAKDNFFQAKGFVFLKEKQPYWSVSSGRDTSSYIIFDVDETKLKDSIKKIRLDISSKFQANHQTQNVWGLVKGKTYPDSLILITAHYDHLGKMGQVIYPGGNDNASGTAMVLELARYFAIPENQPAVSIMFVLYSGEEVGLMGSRYMAKHFPFPLEQIKLQINLDMVASGSEGITIVNGKQFPEIFQRFVDINNAHKYLSKVKVRGESCNSDHCPLYQKGVVSVFIYTLGPECWAYHIPQDNYASLPLTEFADLFHLIVDFVQE